MDMITTTATTTRRVTRTARGDAMSQLATRARVASSATATTRARRRGGDGAGERASAPVVAPRLGSRCRRRVVLARRRASEEPLVARVSSAAPEERARRRRRRRRRRPEAATDERGRGDRAEERRRRGRGVVGVVRGAREQSRQPVPRDARAVPVAAAAAGADSLSAVAGRHQARGDAASIRVRDRGRHERHPDGPVPGARTDGRGLSTSAFYPCARARVPTPVRSVAAAAASARRPT